MHKIRYFLYFLFFIFLLLSCNTADRNTRQLEKNKKFHQKLLTIDSHADTPLRLMREGYDISAKNDPHRGGGKIDFKRMKEGGLDGVFFAVYVRQGTRDSAGYNDARQKALATFDSIRAVIKRYPDIAEPGKSADELDKINRNGKLAIFIGVENGYAFGRDLNLLKKYYDLGARYITLCHSENNDICDSSTGGNGPEHEGLSKFGEEVVKEMNRLGIIIDVSHASDETFYNVLAISRAPVIASHSGSRALCDHPRNLSDEMLLSLAQKGGVIQVCTVSEYIAETLPYPERDSAKQEVISKYGRYYELPPEKREAFLEAWFKVDSIFPPHLASVSDFVDHIDHIVQVTGIDHVGIGTDFDGGGELTGCYDVSELENITFELLKRGYSKEDIQKIWSGNLLRVFREVEKASDQYKN